MDLFTIISGAFLILAACLVIYVFLRQTSRSKLPRAVIKRVKSEWDHVKSIEEPAARLMEAEKVADGLLSALDYQGTFAEKLISTGPRFTNIESVWSAHKLRNRIAHEPGMKITEKDADQAVKAFESVVRMFVKI